MDTKYPTKKAAKILGVKMSTLKQWVFRGFVDPETPAQGTGTRNMFSREDLYRIALFQRLSATGFALDKASDMARQNFADVREPRHRYSVLYLRRLEEKFTVGDAEIRGDIPSTLPEGHAGMVILDRLQIADWVDDRSK